MSSPLAIAAVTAVLKDLLNDGLIDNDLSRVGSFSVTAAPPDRVTTGETEQNRLNLFLYRVTPNQGWRNAALPAHGPRGERLTNPPLALDLHYLLTAYGQTDLNAEILLGYAMEILHNNGTIARDAIRRSLSPDNPITVALIPDDGQGRNAVDLADQVETLKITPEYFNADELSRMWTAMQARYRPSVAYQVSTVLIEAKRPVVIGLPVLQRGKADRGVNSQPDLVAPRPTVPTLDAIQLLPVGGGIRSAAELGDRLILIGSQLSGDAVFAVFSHKQLASPIELPADATSTHTRVVVDLPKVDISAAPDTWPAWPAGHYTVSLKIHRTGKTTPPTDVRGLDIAPRLIGPPQLSGTGATLAVTLRCFPRVLPLQLVEMFVGGQPVVAQPVSQTTDTLTANLAGIDPSDVPVTLLLRVDGVGNQIVRDRAAKPASFDPLQLIPLQGAP
jgi:Pvc16 N-terminal domain